MNPKKIILLTGPTASGKTDLAIETALKTGAEIVSADSRQIYRELNIGVARPTVEQLNTVPHHFIATESIWHDYNAGTYARDARITINQLFERLDTIVVCGGTGLYIKALMKGLDPLPGKNEALRRELELRLDTEGLPALQEQLRQLDPERYTRTELLNPQRLIRAIEIALTPAPGKSDLPAFTHRFETEIIILNPERGLLYERINRRVDMMLEAGLEQEAQNLYACRHLNALQTVGYSEWWPYLEGKTGIGDVVDKIKQHSRNYAKRQITWFRHQNLSTAAF